MTSTASTRHSRKNALLSKFAGGLGNDWTPVRAGSHIKGTNGKSQGVVPFLKVVNDTAVAVNQGGTQGRRVRISWKPGTSTSREFWNSEEHRRRPPPHTRHEHRELVLTCSCARVMEGADWTLFPRAPARTCTTSTARTSEVAYTAYEAKTARGELKLFKKIPALTLWRKMLSDAV